MVKIKTELAKTVEPLEGGSYVLEKAEELSTAVQSFKGIRVIMRSTKKGDDQEYGTMLWNREAASATSKIGAFLKAFEDFLESTEKSQDTDNWLRHEVRFVSWKPKAREIKVVK